MGFHGQQELCWYLQVYMPYKRHEWHDRLPYSGAQLAHVDMGIIICFLGGLLEPQAISD